MILAEEILCTFPSANKEPQALPQCLMPFSNNICHAPYSNAHAHMESCLTMPGYGAGSSVS